MIERIKHKYINRSVAVFSLIVTIVITLSCIALSIVENSHGSILLINLISMFVILLLSAYKTIISSDAIYTEIGFIATVLFYFTQGTIS